MMLWLLLTIVLGVSSFSDGDVLDKKEMGLAPTVYQGRVRPAAAYPVNATLFLPRRHSNEWLPLEVLEREIKNFTPYPDPLFEQIRDLYLQSKEKPFKAELGKLLLSSYSSYLAGTVYQEAAEKSLFYPSVGQLRAEFYYNTSPWMSILLGLYGAAILGLLFRLNFIAWGCLASALVLHTAAIGIRCYILERPPVSNMFETVLYVPWITALISLGLFTVYRYRFFLSIAALVPLSLLLALKIFDLQDQLTNVQAVLDSQYWLVIHVLLVVGSYGVFALASCLAHLYLWKRFRNSRKEPEDAKISKCILQTLYLGTFMLITGTLLGGVWAAESWGRFWDWDPKESWAFVSCSFYVIWIHAYRFRYLQDFGLAIGAAVGFLAITFTWYGVNYILGIGLHSYGFGSGGGSYYYLAAFLADLAFLGLISSVLFRSLYSTNSIGVTQRHRR